MQIGGVTQVFVAPVSQCRFAHSLLVVHAAPSALNAVHFKVV